MPIWYNMIFIYVFTLYMIIYTWYMIWYMYILYILSVYISFHISYINIILWLLYDIWYLMPHHLGIGFRCICGSWFAFETSWIYDTMFLVWYMLNKRYIICYVVIGKMFYQRFTTPVYIQTKQRHNGYLLLVQKRIIITSIIDHNNMLFNT